MKLSSLSSRLLMVVLCLSLAGMAAAQGNDASTCLDQQRRSEIIDTTLSLVERYYIETDKIPTIIASIRQNEQSRKYDSLNELGGFRRQLTDDLRSVSGDQHFGVWPIETSTSLWEESEEAQREYAEQARYRNYGFGRIERLPGNIGYLEILDFESPRLCAATGVAAMNYLANCDALIVDLRRNGGGWGETVALICSYFFDESVQLGASYDRFQDKTTQVWTQTYVPGASLSKIPVYVLQSSRSFSAAEDFGYSLQALGRATVVGEQSRGGGHPVNDFNLPEYSICITIPIAKSVNPITGTNWEGVGVTPDIAVPAEKALPRACIEAANALLAKTEDSTRIVSLQLVLERYRAEYEPVTVDVNRLRKLAGEYRYSGSYVCEVQYRDGGLLLTRQGTLPNRLLPCGDKCFAMVEQEGTVQFEVDGKGKIVGLTVTLPDGEHTYERVK